MHAFAPALNLNRRHFLKNVTVAGLSAATLPQVPDCFATSVPVWQTRCLQQLETHRRADGGYAWTDQERSHLTPTFAAIGCYHLFGQMPPGKVGLAEFVKTHHPGKLKKLEQEHRQFEYQQIQALVWLNEDVTGFAKIGSWTRPTIYLKQYEQHGWPVFASEVSVFICRRLLGIPTDDLDPDYVHYLHSRRRENGSFNNSPAAAGGDGHVVNTWWGLQALQALRFEDPLRERTIHWLKRCQTSNGAFTWQPAPAFASVPNAVDTWAAVKSLRALGSDPNDPERCISYLLSLSTPQGGFAIRPGWSSNPLATYYVLDALASLNAIHRAGRPSSAARRAVAKPPRDAKVFSLQIEAHGRGSPADAVELARSLRIHLWGAKNPPAGWISRAQKLAEARKVPVTFFVSNEEYNTWLNVPGFGTYSHTSDVIAPANESAGASLAGKDPVSWSEFRDQRLAPLQHAGSRLIWQFGENEELVRVFLDDSVDRGGYAAISTFHFGNPDFTNSEPFLKHYEGVLPFVALQDAHGEEPWWFAEMTSGFRTLFVARDCSWKSWLEALHNNWVVAVRHDAVSKFETWMHGGTAEVRALVERRKSDWQWWHNAEISRPMLSIVALSPEDTFESGRPKRGVALRVRCARENTTQGLPKDPIASFVEMKLDGKEVSPKLVSNRRSQSAVLLDEYHLHEAPDIGLGKHICSAAARVLGTGQFVVRELEFTVHSQQ